MTLLDFIKALKNKDINVTVIDGENDDTIITFLSQGIDGVEGDVSARPVKNWKMTGSTAIEVTLGVAEP